MKQSVEKYAMLRRRRLLMMGGIILLVLVLVRLALIQVGSKPAAQASGGSSVQLAAPSIGPASAKVAIIEYGDFGCPTCRGWYKAGVLKQLLAAYGDKIRFEWRDFPIITPESPLAAEAGQCAFDQGTFWEYHDLLYDRAPLLTAANLKAAAVQIGLDPVKFDKCLASGQERVRVQRTWQEAEQRGFRATPSFLVNDHPLIGPASFEQFKSLIDPLLASGG